MDLLRIPGFAANGAATIYASPNLQALLVMAQRIRCLDQATAHFGACLKAP
ncbi:MAG TPA: hypothetical protein VIY49_14060 [Bryobacteraceae bacterium]